MTHDSWEDMNYYEQAQLIAYDQIRQAEDGQLAEAMIFGRLLR